jgi:hypothetical protein
MIRDTDPGAVDGSSFHPLSPEQEAKDREHARNMPKAPEGRIEGMTDTVPGEGHTKGLSELLAKVQAASGADRTLDLDLARALVPDVIVLKHDNGANVPHVYWKYTGSIDDALALVERVLPGWWYHMAKKRLSPDEPLFACALYPPGASDPQLDQEPEEASTQPLAIIKALLTAIGDSQP